MNDIYELILFDNTKILTFNMYDQKVSDVITIS